MSRSSPPAWNLVANAPIWLQVIFWLVVAVMAISFVQTMAITVASLRGQRRGLLRPSPGRQPSAARGTRESDYLWVFIVPALNEATVITDSVSRLEAVQATNKVILVVNDGSDDATGEVLADLDVPDLRVLTRVLPDARKGKAAALNDGLRYVRTLRAERFPEIDDDRVVIAIVDADGRLDAHAPRVLARHFADPSVGGAQVLVRIYNRDGLLTREQDLEFGVFGHVMQAGRSRWGTANMGGNGQFNRLSALLSIDDGGGPWRHRLTEDQDLGIRLLQSGWCCVQENAAAVHQQGVPSLRRLYRQRTRWAQGAWQAMGLLPSVMSMHQRVAARLDAVIYLVMPILQFVVTGDLFFAVGYSIAKHSDPASRHVVLDAIMVLVMLSYFVPSFLVAARRARGPEGAGMLLAGLLYPFYAWMLMPTLVVALVRQVSGRTAWAKTSREPMPA